jgi:hypothetical protein
MAGDVAQAKQILRAECMRKGLCVTILTTNYIYAGGEESGFIVELINYPRFPGDSAAIWVGAKRIGRLLCRKLYQDSFLVMDSTMTTWSTRRK